MLLSHYTGNEPILYPDVEGMDKNAYDIELSPFNSLFGVRKNSEDTFSYKIKRHIEADSGLFGNAYITNPIENNCLMAVEMTLEGEDDVIYRSGYLKPNQRVDEIKLAKELSPGKYDVTVYFCAVSFDTFELLGILEENVSLSVA